MPWVKACTSSYMDKEPECVRAGTDAKIDTQLLRVLQAEGFSITH